MSSFVKKIGPVSRAQKTDFFWIVKSGQPNPSMRFCSAHARGSSVASSLAGVSFSGCRPSTIAVTISGSRQASFAIFIIRTRQLPVSRAHHFVITAVPEERRVGPLDPAALGHGGKQIAAVDGHASGQRVATCECHSWHQVDMANRQVAARARGDASRPTAKKRNTNAAFEEVKFAFLKGGQF